VYQQQGIGLEQRLSELQAQIDQLNLSLHLWRQREEQIPPPTERRLLELTDRCAEILDQWSTAGERHAKALVQIESRLSGLTALETRVQHDAAERIHGLERVIEHEWVALRQIHEEPVKQLREQAATLAEVCVAAAATAQRSFERAEARLASLEADLHRRMSELARELHPASGSRPDGVRPAALSSGTAAWPLEGVMRLHEQLRQHPEEGAGGFQQEPEPPPPAAPAAALAAADGLSERVSTLEHVINEGQAELRAVAQRDDRARRAWWIGGAALVVATALAGAFAWQSQESAAAAAARSAAAEEQAQRVRDTASQQVAVARDEAARQIAAARETATRAQTIGDVLAAPDVIRFNLAGGKAEARYSGQLLWSRSRGLVFSASHLPAPPTGSAYQLWLATNGAPVSAGTFTPDTSGKATVATDTAPRIPRPVVDVLVTLEKAAGAEAPTGAPVLARATPRAAIQ
jgi:hypothetical protein